MQSIYYHLDRLPQIGEKCNTARVKNKVIRAIKPREDNLPSKKCRLIGGVPLPQASFSYSRADHPSLRPMRSIIRLNLAIRRSLSSTACTRCSQTSLGLAEPPSERGAHKPKGKCQHPQCLEKMLGVGGLFLSGVGISNPRRQCHLEDGRHAVSKSGDVTVPAEIPIRDRLSTHACQDLTRSRIKP